MLIPNWEITYRRADSEKREMIVFIDNVHSSYCVVLELKVRVIYIFQSYLAVIVLEKPQNLMGGQRYGSSMHTQIFGTINIISFV